MQAWSEMTNSSALLYLMIGNALLVLAYNAIPKERQPDLKGLKGVIAFILGTALWPVAIITIWYDQQRECWKKGQVQAKTWLKEKESSGKYAWGRVTLIIRFPPRKVLWQRDNQILLLRPRPSFKSPVLVSPNAIHLNFIACQVVAMRDLP